MTLLHSTQSSFTKYFLHLRKVTIYLLTSCNTEERIAQNIYIHNSNRNYKKLTTTTIINQEPDRHRLLLFFFIKIFVKLDKVTFSCNVEPDFVNGPTMSGPNLQIQTQTGPNQKLNKSSEQAWNSSKITLIQKPSLFSLYIFLGLQLCKTI